MNIKKASHILKTDLGYIVKGSSAMVTGQGLVTLIALASSVAFANLLPKDIFGTYQYILTVSEFIMVISLTALSSSVIRSVAKGHEGTLRYTFRENLKWSIGSLILGLCISGYYFTQHNFILGFGILLASCFAPLITSAKLYIAHLVGKKWFTKSASLSVIGNLIPTLILVGALFFTDNVLILIALYFVCHATVNLILHHKILGTAENDSIDPGTIPYAKHLSYQNAIVKVAGHLDKILLFQFTGSVALAEYLFAISVPRQFQHFFKSAKSIVLPKVSTKSFDDLQKTLPRKIGLLYLFVIPATILYILLAPFIFKIAFPLYTSSVIYSQVYATIFLVLPLTIMNDVFIGQAKKKILYNISVVNSVIKIATTALFVPLYGIWGVLASILVTETLSYLQVVYYFFKKEPSSKPENH